MTKKDLIDILDNVTDETKIIFIGNKTIFDELDIFFKDDSNNLIINLEEYQKKSKRN